ncbi:hypothetical protein [Yellowstone lake mimivirus]|uniref:hypothetical protein n=1 Tax=Yellowstone lake mimivirus TaxID=1586712 RepID=UPI0006EBDAF5|nr:hypothetical protein AR680_gp034 [Yellowstone lake mimivirus]BAT21958.1 hypothetical protein [Yellowstone lake mimivirus]
MDDFNVSSLHESKNEWAARLINIFTPLVIEGYKSIFNEALQLCKQNNEIDKYLMTFQNFISRVPKWNTAIIEQERKRINDKSGCGYLEDLITCVHIIQLKILTSMRAGNKQKKINITIPKLDEFIHKIYINVARKVYKNVYLFEINIPPLQIQKYQRELEIIVQECILITIRESIPVETILKAYMDETIEEEVIEEIKEQLIEPPPPSQIVHPSSSAHSSVSEHTSSASSSSSYSEQSGTKLKFDDNDHYLDTNNNKSSVNAPKTIDRLEEISNIRANQRRIEQENDDNDNDERITISNNDISLDNLDIQHISLDMDELPDLLKDEIETLN